MSWYCCDKIIQHEVARKREATQEVDSNNHYLKFSKSINISKNILKLHCCVFLQCDGSSCKISKARLTPLCPMPVYWEIHQSFQFLPIMYELRHLVKPCNLVKPRLQVKGVNILLYKAAANILLSKNSMQLSYDLFRKKIGSPLLLLICSWAL